MKNSYTLKRYIDTNIKVGDKVRLHDGSALSCDKSEKDIFIVFSYPEITGIKDITLKDSEATVIKTGITNKIVVGPAGIAYLQDIIIKIGKAELRTASKFVATI